MASISAGSVQRETKRVWCLYSSSFHDLATPVHEGASRMFEVKYAPGRGGSKRRLRLPAFRMAQMHPRMPHDVDGQVGGGGRL
jgi:hypothetical protein